MTPGFFAGIEGAIVCLSSQEWDVPLWTNRQHVMSRLARRQPVAFVHTAYFLPRRAAQVLRLPAGERRERLAELTGGLRPRADGPSLFSAWNLAPLGRSNRAAARLNGLVTRARLRRALARAGTSPAVAWVYDPFSGPIVEGLGARLTVYHCVDDHAAQAEGARRRALERAEDELLESVDVVFTTAGSLAERLAARHPRVHALGNVADYDHFSSAVGADPLPEVAALPRPRAVFVGALNELKLDVGALEALADAEPGLSLVVAGPRTLAGPAFSARLDALGARPNVTLAGGRPYAGLPRLLAGMDVALVPYLRNRYTAGVFPMKVYEYLAAGLPVVATGLPELAGLGSQVRLADDPGAFVAAVREALAADGGVAGRQALARANTWEARTAEMDRLAREALAAGPR